MGAPDRASIMLIKLTLKGVPGKNPDSLTAQALTA
jgi:hypothetical protein